MNGKQQVTVGEEVVITSGGGGGGARTYRGTVTKVARVWVTIEMNRYGRPEELRFRLDDQTDGSGYTHGYRFYTLDQWAERERQTEAERFLREQGVTIDWESPWKGCQVELAAVIRAHLDAEAAKTTGPVTV